MPRRNREVFSVKNEAKHVTDADIAISSRIRLARNLESYPFTVRMSKMQSTEVLKKVRDAVFSGENAGGLSFSYLDLQSLTPLDKQFSWKAPDQPGVYGRRYLQGCYHKQG